MMSKKMLSILTIIFLFLIKNAYTYENKIILKIDNQIITNLDVVKETQYLKALNPKIKNLNKDKIIKIGKNSLIREEIKKKEILKYVKQIEIDKKYLDKLIKLRYSGLNLGSKKDFLDYLNKYEIKLETIEKKITIEALWNQVIFSKFSSKLKINKDGLRQQIKENNSSDLKSYLLSEILFTISEKKKLMDKYKDIKKAILENGFENSALIFSESDNAELGGKLGWVREDALVQIIKKELSELKIDNITKPIFTPNGYLILKIENIKYIKKDYDIEKELKKLVDFKTNQQLNQYSNYYFNKIKKDSIINEF